MTIRSWRTNVAERKCRRCLVALLGPVLLASCAAAPFLIPVAFEFARNLLQTGLQNYGSKHRDNLSNLVNRLSGPYTQGLPPSAMGGPGLPAQPGFAGQPGMPQQPIPGQPGMGQPPFQGQPGVADPNNPYGTIPGSAAYSGGMASGVPMQPGLPQQQYPGQQTMPGQSGMNPYDPNNPYGTGAANPYGQQNPYAPQMPYGQQVNPYGAPGSNPYGANPYGTPNPYGSTPQYGAQNSMAANPYGQQNPYGTMNQYGATAYPPQQGYDPNNPYGMGAAQQGYGQVQPGFGQPQQGYGSPQSFGQPQQQQPYGAYGAPGQQQYGGQPYGATGIYPRGVDGEPVAVDVAMIRQKQTSKGKEVVLMTDGEVMKDGGADTEAGDRFKIVVRTNCDCYLYIMSIDGSSWAEPVFPGKDSRIANPVKKDQEYAFPEAGQWYTLDQIKGIETFFVVASANRRTDLEESFAQLAGEKRPDTKMVAKVEEPPIIPRGVGSVTSRGILKIRDDTGAALTVTPLSYAASQSGQDVTVTRWFKHE